MTKPRPPKKKAPIPEPPRPAAPARPVEARVSWLVASALVSAVLVAGAAFLPAQRLWGLNHLAFVPPVARYAAIALIFLAFIPLVAKPLYAGAVRLFDVIGFSKRGMVAWILVAASALAATSVFWTLRSSTLLLGDGQLLVRSFEAAEEGYQKVIMRSAKAIANEETIAPGTTLSYYGAIKTGAKFKQPPLNSMRGFNCILGGLLILLLGTVATGNFARGEIRLWLIMLAIASATIELFFGYIENYTTPTLLLAVYVVLAFRALHARGPAWLAMVPLGMACYAHVQSILFIPSFVYLVIWTVSPSRRPALLRYWTTAFTALAIIGVMIAPVMIKVRKFYVPLGFSNAKYAILSPNHLADIVNELFMLLPILPVVGTMAWVGRRAERASGRDATRDARATKTPTEWFTHPAEWQFVATILVPCALYILFFHPAIGMARDWDLFTMSTTALVPFVLLVLNRYIRVTGVSMETVARFAAPSLLILMVSSMAWISVNASTHRTIDRFKSILTYDRTHASYAWENLAILQHDRKELDAAIATMRIAVDNSHNPRQSVRLAVYLDEAGKTEEAKQILRKILERRPEFSKARFRLLLFLEKESAWDQILSVARDGVKYSSEDSIYTFFYGEALIRAGRVDEGIALFRQCTKLDLPASAMQHIAETLKAYEAQTKK